jgi:hypothetical protein
MNLENAILSFLDPGRGNLNIRAYIASVVGPRRVAHGQKIKLDLVTQMPTKILGNTGVQANQGVCAYVAVALLASDAVVREAMFSSGEMVGANTAIPSVMVNTMGPGAGNSFSAVLLPGDTLYAQAIGANFSVITSAVWF